MYIHKKNLILGVICDKYIIINIPIIIKLINDDVKVKGSCASKIRVTSVAWRRCLQVSLENIFKFIWQEKNITTLINTYTANILLKNYRNRISDENIDF